MGLLKDLYKSLTKTPARAKGSKGSRGGSKPTPRKKKRDNKPKGSRGSGASNQSGGSSKGSGGSSRPSGSGRSNNKPETRSNNRPKTSRPSGGISNHRSGGIGGRKSGSGAIAPNSRGIERREGAERAKVGTAGKIALGTLKYTGQRYAGYAVKAVDSSSKRAIETAGNGRKGGQLTGPTRREDRRTSAQQKQANKFYEQKQKNKEKAKKIAESGHVVKRTKWNPETKKNETVYEEYNKGTKNASKKIEKAKENTLNQAVSNLSSEKKYKAPKWAQKFVGDGDFSAQDIAKGSMKAASEMIDYAIPYGGSSRAFLKGSEKILKATKGAKMLTATTKTGGKALTKEGEKAVADIASKLVKEGKPAKDAIKSATKKVMRSDRASNIQKEILANALQDATIGTTLDAAKGKEQGLKGKEFRNYMLESAAMNAIIGGPISAVAGRTGKAGKNAIKSGIADNINKSFNLSPKEAKELVNLQFVKDSAKGNANLKGGTNASGFTKEQKARYSELMKKANTPNDVVKINNKGKIVALDNNATKALSPVERKEYLALNAQNRAGAITAKNKTRLNELNTKVKQAQEAVDFNANAVIDNGGAKDVQIPREQLESAVKHFENTGETAKLKKAQKLLDNDIKAATKRSEDAVKAIDSIGKTTGVKYRLATSDDIAQLSGGKASKDEFVNGFVHTNKDGELGVVVNKEAPQAAQTIIGHETAHIIKSNSSEEFEKLGESLRDYARKIGEYDDFEAAMKKNYPELDEAGLNEEITSELVGRYIFGENNDFIKRLAGEKPNLARRIIEYVKDLMRKIENPELAAQLKSMSDEVEELVGDIKTQNSTNRVDINGVQYSKNANNEALVKITPETTEAEKVDILSRAAIDPPAVNEVRALSSASDLNALKNQALSDAEDTLEVLGKRFGLFDRKLKNKVLDLEVVYSKGSVHKSTLKQTKASGSFEELGKAMLCLRELSGRAVPIEAHSDRYVGTLRQDMNHKASYVLLSAFQDKTHITPVELLINERKGNQTNNLYVTVSLGEKKKKTVDAGGLSANGEGSPAMSSNVTIPDLIRSINPEDSEFLKYIPDEFLSKEQLKGKAKGLNDEAEELKKLRQKALDKRYELERLVEERKKSGLSTKNAEKELARVNKLINKNRSDYVADGLLQPTQMKFSKGYHAGDLGKAEPRSSMSGSRHTGHYGTGTYFVGDEAQISMGNYGSRPHETVDFDKYHLWKPRLQSDARELHDFLRKVNTHWDAYDSAFAKASGDPMREDSFFALRRKGKKIYDEYWDRAMDGSGKELTQDEINAFGKRYKDFFKETDTERLHDDVVGHDFDGNYTERMLDDLNDIIDDKTSKWNKWAKETNDFFSTDVLGDLYKATRLFPDVGPNRLKKALEEVADDMRADKTPQNVQDTASTRLMKKLGYEGVDVRGTDMDNTGGGSVIYDLKGEDLARKKEIGTARFSKTRKEVAEPTRDERFQELEDLEKEWNELNEKKMTPEVEARAKEIVNRMDEISRGLGGERVTKANADEAVKSIESKTQDDATLLKRNADVVKDSDDPLAGLERPTPDSGTLPKELKQNRKMAKFTKDNVADYLKMETDTTFSKKDLKDIGDRTERISNMIANNDRAGAKAEVEKLVDDYYNAPDHLEEPREPGDIKNDKDDLLALKKQIRETTFKLPKGERAQPTLKQFYEDIGLPRTGKRGFNVRVNSGGGYTPLAGRFESNKVMMGIDEVYPELQAEFPELLPKYDTGDYYQQFRALVSVFNTKVADIPTTTRIPVEPKELKDFVAGEILSAAEKNAGAYKGVNEPKPFKDISKMSEDELQAHIRGEEKHLKNAIDKYGADSNRVKEIRQHIEKSKNSLDEMRGERKAKEPKPEPKQEPKQETPKPKETKAEAPKEPEKTPPGFENLTSEDLPKAFREEAEKEAREAKAKEKPNDPLGYTVYKPDGVDSKFTNWFREAFTSFRRKTESSLVGFERAASKSGSKDLRHQATEVYLAKNRATSWIEGERAGFDRKVSRDGLNTIFEKNNLFGKKNKERKADFSNYLLYKHAINRLDFDKPVHMADGGGSAYSKADYEAMIKQIEDKYPKSELEGFAKDIKGYFDDLMQYRVDSGLVTKDFADTMAKRYPNYVPTYRDNDDWLRGLTTIDNSLEARISQSVKTAKGGSAPIEDLYQQMARLTKTTIRDAEENVLMNTYAKVLGFDGVEKLPEGTKLDDIANSAITISDKGSGGWNVTFWHEGEPVNMAVNKQIALGLKEFNGDSYRKLVAASSKLNKFGTAYKRLITDWNLLFGVRNGARDLQQAAVNSKDSKAFAANIPNAWRAIASPKNNPYMRLYKANGGMYSTLVQQGKQIREPGTKNLFSKGVDNSVGHAIKAIEKVNGAIEIAPRLAEFIGTINKHADAALKKKGSSIKQLREATAKDMFPNKKIADLTADELEKLEDGVANKLVDMVGKDVIDEAMHNAADITLNFSRSGAFTKALNAGPVPYLNPSVQGLSKTIRLFSEGKAEGWKSLLNIGMKIGTLTIAPALFNEAMLADDKAYQSLNTRDKDTNFFIPIGDGKFIKVPKPRENAVMAEPFGYGIRYFMDKAHVGVIEEGEYSGWKDLGQMFKSAVDNIGPVNPLSDNIFSPLIRLAQNKTWYGGSIDSTSDVLGLSEGTLKHSDVRDETTSYYAKEIADFKIGGKKVSDIMHLSPKKIDDFMDSYLGVIYDLGIAPTSDANHGNPILTQFVKDSVFSNKNGTELWSEFEKTMAPDTVAGKVTRAAKKAVLGNTKWTIEGKNTEAKDWLNLKGYDDITYSDARNKILYDKDLTQKQKDAYDRKIKIWQNEMRRDLVYGKKEVTPEMDPIRKISSIFGVDKAMKDFTYTYEDPETGEKKNQHLDAWNAFKKSGSYKKDSKAASAKFIDFYSKMRWTNGKIGESKSFPSWMAASVIAATEKGNNDDLAKAYIRPSWDDGGETTEKIIQRGKNYRDYGFTQGYFRTSQRSIFKAGRDLGYEYTSKLQPWDKAMALATDKKKFADGAYYSADTSGKVSRRMKYARYLNKTEHSTAEINKFAKKYKLELPKYDESQTKEQRSQSWKAFNAKVEAAVNEAYKDAPDAVKASVYHVITDDNYNFPFGKIGDQKQKNDTGITDLDKYEGGGWGRGGRRGRRGGRRGRRGRGGGGSGGSGGGGTAPKTATGAIDGKVTDPFGKVSGKAGKSNLDDAYRKKYAKLIAESRKKY